MSQYYLMAQLPSLDAIGENTPLPITEARFYELCERFLGKREAAILGALTLSPKPNMAKVGNELVDAWNEGEIQLRLALSVIRASKHNKPSDINAAEISSQYMQLARTAAEMSDPMEAELYLNRFRIERLEALRPTDAFCQSAVFYYALRLKLITRIRSFDAACGEREYKNIYNSIMYGERQETVQ